MSDLLVTPGRGAGAKKSGQPHGMQGKSVGKKLFSSLRVALAESLAELTHAIRFPGLPSSRSGLRQAAWEAGSRGR